MKYLYKRVVASAMVLFVAPIMTSTTFAQDDVIAPTVDIAQSVTTPAAGATEDVTPTPIVAPQEGPSTTDVMQTVEAVSPSADVVETEPTEESATISTALAPITDDTASEAGVALQALALPIPPAPALTGSDLSMTITSSVSTGTVGDSVTYTVTYANAGDISTGVVIAVEIPGSLAPLMTGWTAAGAGVYTYNVGTMAVGATGTLSYTVILATGTFLGSIVTTYGQISSTPLDAYQDNNYPFAEVTIFAATNNCNCGGTNSLRGAVAVDLERNKQLNITDITLSGQQLTLYKDGTLFGYATTSQTGSYAFTNLPDGNYRVMLTPTTGTLTNFWAMPGTYFTGTTDNLLTISGVVLTGGQHSVANDFLLATPANTVQGVVYFDASRDNTYAAGDAPQAGQTVTLYKDGILYATTYTSSTGAYSFINLPNGTYSLSYTNGTAYTPAVANIGTLGGQTNGLQTIMGIVLSGGVSSVSNNFGLTTTQLSFAGGGMGTSGYTPVDPSNPVVPVGPTEPTNPTNPVDPTIPTEPSTMIPLGPTDDTSLPPSSTDVDAPGQAPRVPCVLGNARDMTCMPATGVDTDVIMNIIYALGTLLALGCGIYLVRRRLS